MLHKTFIKMTALGVAFAALIGCATASNTAPRATLQAFKSEQEIADLFKGWAEEQRRRVEEQRKAREAARAQSPK